MRCHDKFKAGEDIRFADPRWTSGMWQTELEYVTLFRCKTASWNVGDRLVCCKGKNSVPREFLEFSGLGLDNFGFCLMNISVYRLLKNIEVNAAKERVIRQYVTKSQTLSNIPASPSSNSTHFFKLPYVGPFSIVAQNRLRNVIVTILMLS